MLKPMRTAIGLLDESMRAALHRGIKSIRVDLEDGKLTASAAHALIYLAVLAPFQSAYASSLMELKDNEGEATPNYFEQMKQNPQAVYRIRCFANAYLPLLADCDPAHWSLVSVDDESPKISLDQSWSFACIQARVLDMFAKLQA